MGAYFVLVSRVLIDMRRDQNGKFFFVRWQRNRAFDLSPCALSSVYDFLSRLVNQAVIEGFKPDSDALILHLRLSPKNRCKRTGYCPLS